MKEKIQKIFIEFIVTFAIWILLSISKQTYYNIFDAQAIIAGVIAAALCTYFFSSMYPQNTIQIFNPRRIFWFVMYLPAFIWACFLSNLDVAYRVLNVNMPIRPGIVKVKTKIKSEMGKAFLANSITLTPGTMTVDIVGDTLYIHWINVVTDDPSRHTEIIVSQFEKYIERIFD